MTIETLSNGLKNESASITHLRNRRAELVKKIDRAADAIENMGINETLAQRPTTLESKKTEVEADIVNANQTRTPAVEFSAVLPPLSDGSRKIVGNMSKPCAGPARAR